MSLHLYVMSEFVPVAYLCVRKRSGLTLVLCEFVLFCFLGEFVFVH